MESAAALVTAIGGCVAVVIGAWAALAKARAPMEAAKVALERLWDFLTYTPEGTGRDPDAPLVDRVPPTIKATVERALTGGEEE